jgi:hypothetical protein
VPTHERLWFDRPVLTHAASEWAMDAHVMPHLFARPADVMRAHHGRLADYAVEHFRCSGHAARRALGCLGKGETLLRASGLPRLLFNGARVLDSRLVRRFDWYLAETTARLVQINRLIDGDAPVWGAELEDSGAARQPLKRLPANLFGAPLPQDFF